jgi:hypothetical protein
MSKITDYIRGDTRVIQVNCVQSDGVTPLDLTGATVYFTLNSSNAPTDDSGDALQKTVTSHTAPILGQTSITILPADTTGLTPGDYYYDVQVKDANGNISSLKQDIFRINADITRTTS